MRMNLFGNVLLRLTSYSLILNAIEEVVDEILLKCVHFAFVNKYVRVWVCIE